MDRNQWLKERRKTLGASDVPIILGLTTWSSPAQVLASKKGQDTFEETQAMRLGNYLQEGIAKEAMNQIGGEIEFNELHLVHDNGWASATPDYIIRKGDELAILEIKCTHERTWDAVPEHYLLQVHWQCWVHGINKAYVAVLHGSSKVECHEIKVDLESEWFIRAVEVAAAWWTRHVVCHEPIESKPADPEALKTAIRAASGTSVDLGVDILAKLIRISEIKREVSPANHELDQLEKEVKDAIGTAEVALYKGKTLATYKETVSKRFDTKKFQSEQPEMAKKYTTESVSRRFLLKEDAVGSLAEWY